MNDSQTFDETHLRRLSPLEGMKTASLSSLARKITLKELAANRELFRAGDSDRRTLWLISGRLELLEGNRTLPTLVAGIRQTGPPPLPTLPRKFTARAINPS